MSQPRADRSLPLKFTPLVLALSLLACGGNLHLDDGLDITDTPDEGVVEMFSPVVTSISFSELCSASGSYWFTHPIQVNGPSTIEATLDWPDASSDLNLFLLGPSGPSVAYANGTTAKPEKIRYHAPAAGNYQLAVRCRTGTNQYRLTGTIAPDVSEYRFNGNTSASSKSWQVFKFPATAGEKIEATLNWESASTDLNLFLYRPNGTSSVAYANGTARPEKISYTADASGTWSVAFKCKSGSTAFALLLRTLAGTIPTNPEPPPPEPEPEFIPKYPGQPAPGTLLWGAAVAVDGITDPYVRHEQYVGGAPLTVHRKFYQWSQRTTSMVTDARDTLAKKRVPWFSTKTPGWADMAAGKHDAEIDQMLRALDALGGPVWLTCHHEPEGGGGVNAPDDPAGPSGHLAMNRRVRQRMTALGTKNIALGPVLMAYTWTTASGRNPDAWWGDGVYDFVGIDMYNESELSLINDRFKLIRRWAQARNTDVAVGEWGMRGTDAAAGDRVRELFNHSANSATDGLGARVVAMTNFDNSDVTKAAWYLQGGQLEAFRQLLLDPRKAVVVP